MTDFTKPNVPKNYNTTLDYTRRIAQAINQMLEDSFMARFIMSRIVTGTNGTATLANDIITFDAVTTGRGFKFPQFTTTTRNAISSPVKGETIFNTTTNKAETYDGTTWQPLW